MYKIDIFLTPRLSKTPHDGPRVKEPAKSPCMPIYGPNKHVPWHCAECQTLMETFIGTRNQVCSWLLTRSATQAFEVQVPYSKLFYRLKYIVTKHFYPRE